MKKSKPDYLPTGIAVALVLHAGLALGVRLLPKEGKRPPRIVEVDIRKIPPPQPPISPPEPEKKEPEPEKKIEKRPQKAEAPKPNKVPEKPVTEPPKPVFGIDQSSTVSDSSIAVPLGNTTMADPQKRPKGPVPDLPPAAAPAGAEYRPISEEQLKERPDHDGAACGGSMQDKYTTSQAYAEGVEGEVVFRIELDERGKIHHIKFVKRLRKDLDEMAMGFLRFNPRCKFTPAIGKDGKPAAFVIERYPVTFELSR